ncbi:MAG: acyl-CoA dehydrogenase family protein [Proteobacteria bacterium]|nr:acyl-CoA dehydrogenase family protein [Pseudomonadota bacterium]
MWPDLDQDTRDWRDRCHAFAEEVILPRRVKYDAENRFPDEVHDIAREWGIPNIEQPVELGGQGLSAVASVVGVEALASVCAPIGFTLGFNDGALHPVRVAGNADQKQEFIGRLVAEKRYGSLALTEPDTSGSNLMGLTTTARKTDRGWVIDGTKAMVCNGGISTQYQVLARTEVNGVGQGLTFFVVPRQDGVTVGPNTNKLGFRAVETPTVRFEGVEITDDHRLGPIGSGSAVMLDTLHTIRVGGAATILGIVVGALNDALPWIRDRQVYGGPLAQKSHVQLALGGAYAKLEMVRRIVLEAARLRDAGLPYGHQAAIGKLHASELALETTAAVVQLFGWRGIDGDHPIQKRYRDARQTSIFEGTTETQKLALFHTLMDLHLRDGKL